MRLERVTSKTELLQSSRDPILIMQFAFGKIDRFATSGSKLESIAHHSIEWPVRNCRPLYVLIAGTQPFHGEPLTKVIVTHLSRAF